MQIIPLTLKINDKIETIEDCSYFSECIESDPNYPINQWKKIVENSKRFHLRNKASIFSFSSIEACLKYLHNDIDYLNKFLRIQHEFKYKQVGFAQKESHYFLTDENNKLQVRIGQLSPGEQLILLTLL